VTSSGNEVVGITSSQGELLTIDECLLKLSVLSTLVSVLDTLVASASVLNTLGSVLDTLGSVFNTLFACQVMSSGNEVVGITSSQGELLTIDECPFTVPLHPKRLK